MQARAIMVSIVLTAVLMVAACSSEPTPVTDAEYLADLQALCADTTTTLDALPRPPEQISVADFAVSAANALDDEAERARTLDVPDEPDELAADHRAFVRNTDEQAAAWRAISTTPQDDAQFGELTVRVGELVRGRNDLVDEMGAPGCRRGEV